MKVDCGFQATGLLKFLGVQESRFASEAITGIEFVAHEMFNYVSRYTL
jgi:hypothetical protein